MGFSNFGLQGSNDPGGAEFSFKCGSGSCFQASTRADSVMANRRKPRLAKVRRQFCSRRPSSSAMYADPGFNPFRPKPESSDFFRNPSSAGVDASGEFKIDGSQYVFGANNSLADLMANYGCVDKGETEGTDADIYGNENGDPKDCLNSDNMGNLFGTRMARPNSFSYEHSDHATGAVRNGVSELSSSLRDSVLGIGEQSKGKLAKEKVFGKVEDACFVFHAGDNNSGEEDPNSNTYGVPPDSSFDLKEDIEVNTNMGEREDVMFVDSDKNGSLEREEFANSVQKNNIVYDDRCESREDADANFNFDSNELPRLEKSKKKQAGFVFRTDSEANSPSHRSEAAKVSGGTVNGLCYHRVHVNGEEAIPSCTQTCSEVDLPYKLKKLFIKTVKDVTPVGASEPSDVTTVSADDTFISKAVRDDGVSSTNIIAESQKGNGNTDFLGSNIFTFGTCKNTAAAYGLSVEAVADNIVKDSSSSNEKILEVGSGGLGSLAVDCESPLFNAPLSFTVNLTHGSNRKVDSRVKSSLSKGHKLKKMRRNFAQMNLDKGQSAQEPVSYKSTPGKTGGPPQCYSPMYFSPCATTGTERHLDETSLLPKEPPFMENIDACTGATCAISSIAKDDEYSVHSLSKGFCMSDTSGVTLGEIGITARSNISSKDDDGENQVCSSNLGENNGRLSSFNSSASGQGDVTSIKRQGKKYRMKIGHISSSTVHGPSLITNNLASRLQDEDENNHVSRSKEREISIANRDKGNLPELTSAEKACDKWRLRGNQAYKNGELSQAEDFYTQGINCIPSAEIEGLRGRPLVLCYNNRAVTRMALGKMREALKDCLLAVSCHPDFLKARIRAGNCHLMLGELKDAMQQFNECLESSKGVCLDRQLMIAASEGLHKGQKVADYINRSAELIKLRTSETLTDALGLIVEALLITPYSERLLEMKAQALCLLRKHKEVINFCQQTLEFAEKNFTGALPEKFVAGGSGCQNILIVTSWRQEMISKCYFHLGKLDSALGVLENQGHGTKNQESQHSLAATIHELQKLKNSGNEAFRSGSYAEAVDHYSSAILSSTESRPFAAICFCNRAAAYQALGQITDAIADCSLAIALDENYVKALSRRATLHEMIRDYKQAADDLQKLVSVLENKALEKQDSGSRSEKESRQVFKRLSSVESQARSGIPMDLYLIMGVKRSDPASEIKKAYRKAALRHHPDKAGQALVRSEGGDDGQLWKDIAALVHKDSDRLFKIIGEAYQVLSDPDKKSEYDHEEDVRKAPKEHNIYKSASRRESDRYNAYYPCTRSSNRRNSYKTYYWSNEDY